MPDIAGVLKEEISRLARKELRQSVDPLKKQILELRTRVREAEHTIAKLQKSTKKAVEAVSEQTGVIVPGPDGEEEDRQVRIPPGSVRKHRERLGLTQTQMAALLGVSSQSIIRWEKGETSPRGASRVAFAQLREMGVREVQARLEEAVR